LERILTQMKEQSNTSRYWLLSGVEAAYWFSYLVASYVTVFLQKQGMSSTQIGILNALMSIAAIVGGPIWGAVSDKVRSPRKVMIILLFVAVAMWALIPAASAVTLGIVPMVMVVLVIGNFFKTPAGALKDTWVVTSANIHKLNYGAIRWWGSIAYAVIAFVMSLILPTIGVKSTFYLYSVATIPMFILAFVGKDEAGASKHIPLREMHFSRLFKNYYYVAFLIMGIFYYLPVNSMINFLPYLMSDMGIDSALIGYIYGYRAIAEIPVLLLMVKFRKKLSLPYLIGIGITLMAADELLLPVCNSLGGMIAVSTAHGLGNGILIGTMTNYVYALAPDDLKATAQTLFASTAAMAGILGNLLGGVLIDAVGVRTAFTTAGLLTMVSLVLLLGTLLAGRFLLKKKLPEAAGTLKS